MGMSNHDIDCEIILTGHFPISCKFKKINNEKVGLPGSSWLYLMGMLDDKCICRKSRGVLDVNNPPHYLTLPPPKAIAEKHDSKLDFNESGS